MRFNPSSPTQTADESLDETLPATRIFLDDAASHAPREARLTLASGRSYEIRVADDGTDHLLVTTRQGSVALRLVVGDDGPVLGCSQDDGGR